MHRRAGFPADLCVEEIPIIVKEASDATYANVDFAIETFRIMGYLPFTRTVLDDANILSSASQEVQQERGKTSSFVSSAKVFLLTPRSPVLLLFKSILLARDQVV